MLFLLTKVIIAGQCMRMILASFWWMVLHTNEGMATTWSSTTPALTNSIYERESIVTNASKRKYVSQWLDT
jgi:hypothetical protein